MRIFQPVKQVLGVLLAFPANVSLDFTPDIGVTKDASGGGSPGFLLASAGECAEVWPGGGILRGKWGVKVMRVCPNGEGFRVSRGVNWG